MHRASSTRAVEPVVLLSPAQKSRYAAGHRRAAAAVAGPCWHQLLPTAASPGPSACLVCTAVASDIMDSPPPRRRPLPPPPLPAPVPARLSLAGPAGCSRRLCERERGMGCC